MITTVAAESVLAKFATPCRVRYLQQCEGIEHQHPKCDVVVRNQHDAVSEIQQRRSRNIPVLRVAQTLMDEMTRPNVFKRWTSEFLLLRPIVVWFFLTLIHSATCLAEDFIEGFETPKVSWNLRVADGEIQRVEHQRVTSGTYQGNGAEHFSFYVTSGPTTVVLDHKLPVARAIDDVKLKLMVRSNRNGSTLGFRVVFPRQSDPRTDSSSTQQLKLSLRGETYTQSPKWQVLNVGVTTKTLQEQSRLLRAKLKPASLDLRDPVVDRVTLELKLDVGQTELFLDELTFGPIVSPTAVSPTASAADSTSLAVSDESVPWPVTFQLDRLLIAGRPFFPRMLPYHNESIDTLRDSGFNTIWISDASDIELQRSLKERGLWCAAVPPRLKSSNGQLLNGDEASLPPIPRDWDNILMWNLGVGMPADARRDVLQWISQVQSADRVRHRPIMADVLGGERIYSRHIQVLGSSRHVLNSDQSLKTYRESLDQHRKLARPGSFMFTWLPTEALPDVARQRQAAGLIPMIVEPEQLRLLAYASLAAGYRGLGFSLSESLESKAPGAEERRFAISQLNFELELLEDFLAGGTLVEQRPFEINAPSSHNVAFRNSAISRADREIQQAAHTSTLRREARLRSELEAAVFRTNNATLLLPIWYEHDAQFVPGKMAAPGATIDVASVPDTAQAWEVTTTRVVNLPSEPIPGGRRIRLPQFDMTAAIIVTSDRKVVESLKRKMESMQAQSARVQIDLAKAKFNRVRIADDELTKLGVGLTDAPQLLAQARRLLQTAESSFPAEALERVLAQAKESGQRTSTNSANVVLLKKNFDEAARLSQASMQALRILQRAHWETATLRLNSPIGSPHTLCFQTLPDHWRLVTSLGKSATRDSVNLLPKGDFEVLDFAALSRFGWQKTVSSDLVGVRADALIFAAPGRDSRCLRIFAAPETNTDVPSIVDTPPISIATPPIPVRAGQILHISGSVRISSPIVGSIEGLTLSDNFTGMTGAWRETQKREWQKIELLREAYQDGEYSLNITLHGIGDVQFDDLKVIAHDQPDPTTSPSNSDSHPDSVAKPGRFDFLQRLPKFPQRAK